MRVGHWAIGLIGSVAAHGGILALVLIAIRPDPVTEQQMPSSELEVQAYQLDRIEAPEQQPESQQAKANTPDGTALDAGAIPQSQARPARPASQPLPPETPSPAPAAQIRQVADSVPQAVPAPTRLNTLHQPQPLIEAAQPAPAILAQLAVPDVAPLLAVLRTDSALSVILPAAASISTITAPASIIPAALPAPAKVPTAVPITDALPQAEVQPGTLPSSTPEPQSAPPEIVDAPQVQPATPNAQKLKAALAFSGGDGDVDPVSIAAFQSFMQPGDIATSGGQLRDGVSGLLAQVPCSRMQVAFNPVTATLEVNGHIPDNDLRAPVLAALREQMGANITVSDNILILPRPQCGALSGIAGVGLPQSTDQITNPLVIGEDAHARVFTFAKGDLLSLDMTAPDYDAFIYLDYFDAEGTVLHLEPNEYAPLRQANAQAAQQIGAKTVQDTGLKLVIGPPYGQEIAVAFAASEPLYDVLRPIQEPAAEYLEWLKTRVEQARADHADFKGEWVYFFVSTADR